jgi:hypothetical protein
MPFDREKAAALIRSDTYEKASPQVKAAIVAGLRQEGAEAGATKPEDIGATTAVTSRGPAKFWKSKAYTWADRLLPFLPAAGAMANGLLAAPKSDDEHSCWQRSWIVVSGRF